MVARHAPARVSRHLGQGRRRALTLAVVALCGLSVALAAGPPDGVASAPRQVTAKPPVLAYYYIWFDERSWDRAKTDYPTLGRYSSSSREVMQAHVRQAKAAGFTGFIVSWKGQEPLSSRLRVLTEIATEEDFKLALVYQALDFDRDPLPVERIMSDLEFFVQRYADEPAFDLFGAPVVIITGTWKFSRDEIAMISGAYSRGHVLGPDGGQAGALNILASERSMDGYERIADLVDGNAYYWSSGDPVTSARYGAQLVEMGEGVREAGGIWLAPAAPGFDARLVGGTKVVERRDGETLRSALDAALGSNPHAIGVISWNEFSENTHIEPSLAFGTDYVAIAAEFLGGAVLPQIDAPPAISPSLREPGEEFTDIDSSSNTGEHVDFVSIPLAFAIMIGIVLIGSLRVLRYRLARRKLG